MVHGTYMYVVAHRDVPGAPCRYMFEAQFMFESLDILEPMYDCFILLPKLVQVCSQKYVAKPRIAI